MCYMFSLMVLECKLLFVKGVLNMLGDCINGLQCQFDYFDLQLDMLMSVMVGIYVDVISLLGLCIQVMGFLVVL